MRETFWLDFGKVAVTKREAYKIGNWVLEVEDPAITTKNKALQCPTIKVSEQVTT